MDQRVATVVGAVGRIPPIVAGLLFLALAIFLGSWLIADGIRDRDRGDVITVTGSAKRRIVSDYVVWTASLTTESAVPGPAVAQLRRWTDRVRRFYANQGVRPGELTVHPISTETPGEISEDTGEPVDVYRLTRTFVVRSSRVRVVAALAEASTSLVAQGVPLAADPPEYVYTKLRTLRPDLIRAAIKDAQLRARVLVDATGAELGKVRGVAVGVFQVTAPNSTEVDDYGAYETSTLTKDVTGVVNVTFALGD